MTKLELHDCASGWIFLTVVATTIAIIHWSSTALVMARTPRSTLRTWSTTPSSWLFRWVTMTTTTTMACITTMAWTPTITLPTTHRIWEKRHNRYSYNSLWWRWRRWWRRWRWRWWRYDLNALNTTTAFAN